MLQDIAVSRKIVEEYLSDVVGVDHGSLTLGSPCLNVVAIVAALLRRGRTQASRMFIDAALLHLSPSTKVRVTMLCGRIFMFVQSWEARKQA